MAKLDTRTLIIHPLISEDAVNLIESENKIVFMVDRRASKPQIRRAVEELYEVRVQSVRTINTPEGRKKALVKLTPEHKASDLAVKLGIL